MPCSHLTLQFVRFCTACPLIRTNHLKCTDRSSHKWSYRSRPSNQCYHPKSGNWLSREVWSTWKHRLCNRVWLSLLVSWSPNRSIAGMTFYHRSSRYSERFGRNLKCTHRSLCSSACQLDTLARRSWCIACSRPSSYQHRGHMRHNRQLCMLGTSCWTGSGNRILQHIGRFGWLHRTTIWIETLCRKLRIICQQELFRWHTQQRTI